VGVMKDIRVIVTVKNAVMLRAMDQAGFSTAIELARASGVNNTTVGLYLNLKLAPYTPSGELRDSIVRIGYALKRLPEDLFPAPFLRRALQTNRVTRDVDAESLPALMATAPPSIAYDPERSFIVKEAVDSLMVALESMKTMDGKSDARGIAVVKHYYGTSSPTSRALRLHIWASSACALAAIPPYAKSAAPARASLRNAWRLPQAWKARRLPIRSNALQPQCRARRFCRPMIKCISGWWYLVGLGAFHGRPFPTRADAAEALRALGAQAP